jgi:hypothetical protein
VVSQVVDVDVDENRSCREFAEAALGSEWAVGTKHVKFYGRLEASAGSPRVASEAWALEVARPFRPQRLTIGGKPGRARQGQGHLARGSGYSITYL